MGLWFAFQLQMRRLLAQGSGESTTAASGSLDGVRPHLEGGLWGGDPTSPHQCSAAEQDHEDDEALKPAVLHDAVAGLAHLPAHGPWQLGAVHSAAGTVANAAYGERGLMVSDVPPIKEEHLGPSPAGKPLCWETHLPLLWRRILSWTRRELGSLSGSLSHLPFRCPSPLRLLHNLTSSQPSSSP